MKHQLLATALAALAAGVTFAASTPILVSSQVRANDPTILDVVYKVTSTNDTVKVRALAFEDGTRSFYNVVRPETFVNDPDGNPTAQNIGDAIAPNVEHKLAWKVSNDWKTDLAKCKFEILVSDQGQLPMDLITIPATAKNGSFVVSYGTQTSSDVFNAMLWYYAAHEEDLVLDDGYLSATNSLAVSDGVRLVNRTALNYNLNVIEYIYDKMGYGLLNGALQEYARKATRKALTPGDVTIYGYKKDGAPEDIYVGERKYCVIDVSAGVNATSYPVTYLDRAPVAGWGDEYKTTKMLLRRIEPGTVVLGGIKPVTLTLPYFIGVFEVTQRQFQLVSDSSAVSYPGGGRPAEMVSWNAIRGSATTYDWPTVIAVDTTSFIGRLRSKAALNIDLPTEAQWEYACKAGNNSKYSNGNDRLILGRGRPNCSDGRGGFFQHTNVGSYISNTWGLYDMIGNVSEWCLDWFGDLNADPKVDWQGPSSGYGKVHRGGNWCGNRDCANGSSGYGVESSEYRDLARDSASYSSGWCGFRLCLTLTGNE